MNNKEMIIQKPAFNEDYFVIGKAVRVIDNIKNTVIDGLIVSSDKDRVGIVKIEWVSPMTGCAGYEPKTFFISVQDMLMDNYKIGKL